MEAEQAKFNKLRGAMMVVVAGCFWGTSGTLQGLAPEGATPLTIGAVRVFATGALMLILALLRDARGFLKGPWPMKPVLLAGFGLTLYQLAFFAAAKMTGAGIAAIIAIGSSPAMAGIMSSLLFGERLSTRWRISTVMAVSGGALLVSGGLVGTMSIDAVGVLLALTAGFAYALEGIGVRMMGGARSSFETVAAIFVASGLMALPFLLTGDTSWILTPHGIVIVLILSVVTSALPFCLFTSGLLIVGVATSYTLSLSEPLTAWLLSTIVLKERLSSTALVGVAVICGAIVLLASEMRTKKA